MKKLLAGVMITILTVSLAACGSSGNNAETQDREMNTVNQETEERSQETQAASQETVAQYIAGSWSDDVYTNESLGMTITLPEGWVCATSEELEAFIDSGQEVTGSTDEELAATDPIYDLFMYNEETGASLNIMAEDYSLYGDITPEEYLQAVTVELQGYEDQGITYTIGSTETITVGNTEFLSVRTQGVYEDSLVFQEYDSAVVGDRMVTIIFTCSGENGEEVREMVYDSITGI